MVFRYKRKQLKATQLHQAGVWRFLHLCNIKTLEKRYLQDSGAFGADERSYGNVDVCGAPLAAIEAKLVLGQSSQFPESF